MFKFSFIKIKNFHDSNSDNIVNWTVMALVHYVACVNVISPLHKHSARLQLYCQTQTTALLPNSRKTTRIYSQKTGPPFFFGIFMSSLFCPYLIPLSTGSLTSTYWMVVNLRSHCTVSYGIVLHAKKQHVMVVSAVTIQSVNTNHAP